MEAGLKAGGYYLRRGRRRRREVQTGPARLVEVEEGPVAPQPPAPPPGLPAGGGVPEPAAASPRPALRVGDEEVSRGGGGLGRGGAGGWSRRAARDLAERGPDAALGVVEVEGGGVRELAQQLPRHGLLQVLHRHHALHHHHWRRGAAAASGVLPGRATHADCLILGEVSLFALEFWEVYSGGVETEEWVERGVGWGRKHFAAKVTVGVAGRFAGT